MQRDYIAFISYRHRPLDSAVAARLHRLIEQYIVPREYRRDGGRRLGYVFRDQDELPLSSDLSQSIRDALDHSRYLVVVCTPALLESRWCMEEIEYFLRHHDRDHVLAVLADGTPETAFPIQLTRTTEGGYVEPLAADLTGNTLRQKLGRLEKESLRLMAAFLGCSYDALYQRGKRRRQKHMLAAAVVFLCVMAGFMGMLLHKNADIRRQLQETQRRESETLTFLSRQSLEEGDRMNAIRYALAALPGAAGERPYLAEAELALAEALYVYGEAGYRCDTVIRQKTAIRNMAMSADGLYAATVDDHKTIRLFDAVSGELLWEKWMRTADDYTLYVQEMVFSSENGLVYAGPGEIGCLDVRSGGYLWRWTDGGVSDCALGEAWALVSRGENSTFPTELALIRLSDGEKTFVSLPGTVQGDYIDGMEGVCFREDVCAVWLWMNEDTGYETVEGCLLAVDLSEGRARKLYMLDTPANRFAWNVCTGFGTEDRLYLALGENISESLAQYRREMICLSLEDGREIVRADLGLGPAIYWIRGTKQAVTLLSSDEILGVHPEDGTALYVDFLPDGLGGFAYYESRYGADCLHLVCGDGGIYIKNMAGSGRSLQAQTNLPVWGAVCRVMPAQYDCILHNDDKGRMTIVRYSPQVTPEVSFTQAEDSAAMAVSGDGAALAFRRETDSGWEYLLLDSATGEVLYQTESQDETIEFQMDSANAAIGGQTKRRQEKELDWIGVSADGTKLVLQNWNELCCRDLASGEIHWYPLLMDTASSDDTGKFGVVTVSMQDRGGDSRIADHAFSLWVDGQPVDMQSAYPGDEEWNRWYLNDAQQEYTRAFDVGSNGLLVLGAFREEGAVYAGEAVYSLSSGAWQWVEAAENGSEAPRICLGHTQPVYARLTDNGKVQIVNGETGRTIYTVETGVPGYAVDSMRFSQDDQVLGMALKLGQMCLVDVQAGKVYHEAIEEFETNAAWSIVRDEERGVVAVTSDRGDGYLLTLDDLAVRARVRGLRGYLIGTGMLLRADEDDEYFLQPMYSLAELIEIAAENEK